MKMRIIRYEKDSKSIALIKAIIKSEDLTAKVEYEVNAIGDSMIKVTGNSDDLNILESVYEMVR